MTALRNQVIEVPLSISIITEECCACGVVFGMTSGFRNERRDDKKTFHCPNGHPQHYLGKSKDEQISDLRHERNDAANNALLAEQKLERERRTRKRIETRAKNGVCPFGCKRSFINVQRHVKTKHADEVPA
jgi:hypothetical protein